MIKTAVTLVVDCYDLKPPGRDILSMSKPREADRLFISARVAKLLGKEFDFMRGDFGKASGNAYSTLLGLHPTQRSDGTPRTKVPFAHYSLVDLIYQTVYSKTNVDERDIFDPMPLPLVCLAATVVG